MVSTLQNFTDQLATSAETQIVVQVYAGRLTGLHINDVSKRTGGVGKEIDGGCSHYSP
jgi:hypothetical protein